MNVLFFLSGAVAIVATIMVLVERIAVHALLYLVLSLLAVALVFYSMGAAFVAALEVIVYAGAIMVLFLFVIMLLNLSAKAVREQDAWFSGAAWAGPVILALVLVGELIWVLASRPGQPMTGQLSDPKQVGIALYGPYLLGVELASVLLLAGVVGAYHIGRREAPDEQKAGEIA
jgi:NADH-quinone oxidoreductase subunit J